MVTSATQECRNSPNMFINSNFRMSIDQPLICVNGYILACQYDGESCTPVFGINIEELLSIVKDELESFNNKMVISSQRCTTPTKCDKSFNKSSATRTSNHSRRASRPIFQRQNSKESMTRRRLFSDPEEFLGISYQTLDQPLRNSFILPLTSSEQSTDRKTPLPGEAMSDITDGYQSVNSSKRIELQTQVHWVEKYGSDYVNTETVTNCSELLALLNLLMKSSTAALVTLKVNTNTEITVTYQFMHKFKHDYMVVRINKGYCMLMKAF